LVFLPAALGLLLAALLSPVANGLRRIKAPRAVAATLALLLAIAVVGGLGTIFGVSVANEFAQLKESMAEGYASFLSWVADVASIPRQELKDSVRNHVDGVKSSIGSFDAATFTRLAGVMQAVTVAGLAVVFTWFFTWGGDRQFKGAVGLL